METQSVEAVKLLSRIEKSLRELIDEAGGSRVDLESNSIALAGRELCWVTVDDQRSLVRHSSALSFDVGDLRRVHADLHRGAWLWSHFWMEAAEGVLHQECDWMREPVIDDDEPVMDGDAALELDYFPRDPQWIPEWMATKAAAHQKVREARERRRQRDRERRAKKKAEAAQAEGTSGSDGPAGE